MTKVAGIAGVARPRFKAPKALLDVVGAVAEWTADRFTRKASALTSAMSGLIGRYLYFDGAGAHTELGFKGGPAAPAIERCVPRFPAARWTSGRPQPGS